MTLSYPVLLSACLLWFSCKSVLGLQEFDDQTPVNNYVRAGYSAINVVQLTQRGYLQFLQYMVDVPPLHEFTFCVWIKSTNFTYSQTLFSYSKDERERLVSAWISPHGTHINLEVQEVLIFSFPIHLKLHHWNYICQSWSAYQGAWALYINAKLIIHGFEQKSSGFAIEGGGDIVVGQEYTDFDKGYEDGIEGSIFGFNLVLASTSTTTLPHPDDYPNDIHFARKRNIPHNNHLRQKRGILDMFRNMLMFFAPVRLKSFAGEQRVVKNEVAVPTTDISRILSNDYRADKPLGLSLVELGYNCVLGRGAPLKGEKVLVSWTKTVVRVFGGAILKPEIPFCIKP